MLAILCIVLVMWWPLTSECLCMICAFYLCWHVMYTVVTCSTLCNVALYTYVRKHKYRYKLHWSTKFNFFFVPRTSVDELSSTFYAEFRYVYRNFLSGKVSKIKTNLNVRKSTLRAHETGRNFRLNVEAYDFRPHLASGTTLFTVQQYSANILEGYLPWYRFSIAIISW